MVTSTTQLNVRFLEACPELTILWQSVSYPDFPAIEYCCLASEEPLLAEPGICYVGSAAALSPLFSALSSLPPDLCITFFVTDADEDLREASSSLRCNLFCVSGKERQVYNTVNRMFSGYLRWVRRLEQMLFHESSPQDLINAISQMLDCPALLLSSSYSLIAANTTADNPPLLTELLRQGFLSFASVQLLQQEEQLDSIPIQQGVSVLAFLLLPREVSLTQKYFLLPVALSCLRQKLSLRRQDFSSKTRTEFRQLLIDLLDSNLTGSEELQSRLSILKPEWKSYFNCMVLEPQKSHLYSAAAAFLIPALEQLFPNGYFFVYHSSVLGLLPSPSRELPEFSADDLGALLLTHHYSAGFIGPVTHLENLRLFYEMATASIHLGSSFGQVSESLWPLLRDTTYPIFVFEDYRLYYLAELCQKSFLLQFPPDTLICLCHPLILRLYQYDLENQSDYLHILETWLMNGCNMTRAGQHLHFHRNSMLYKIHRIETILNISLEQTSLQQNLLFSCIIFRCIKQQGACSGIPGFPFDKEEPS